MENHVFRMHLLRLITTPSLYICMLIQALILQIPLIRPGFCTDAIDAIYMTSQGMFGLEYILLLVLPTIAYSMTCTEDKNSRMLYFWAIRSGAEKYAIYYYLTTLLSGFLTTAGGLLLSFGMAVLRGTPILGRTVNVPFGRYAEFIENGHPVLYVALIVLEYAIGSMVVAGIAAAAAAVFDHKVTVITAPVIVYLLLGYVFTDDNILSASKLMAAGSYSNDPVGQLLMKAFSASVYCIAGGLISVWHIKRGVNNV